MRNAKILLVLMAALAAAGCMRKSPQTYYIMDPQTGQPVPVVSQQQQNAQASYPGGVPQGYVPQGYAPQTYSQPYAGRAAQPSVPARSLYSTSPAYAQQAYAQPQYAQPQQVRQPPSSGRGLFSSSPRTRTYAQPQPQPALQQPYVAQYTPPRAAAPVPRGGAYAQAPAPNYGYAAVSPAAPAYTLDSGDKLRVVVFGQDGITNSYTVDAGGNVNLPLIGAVPARGTSTPQLAKTIADRLRQGYVREPHVTVEVEAYRPFFILGEVTTPGQYPYVANMTVETAVAIAGGFGARASKQKVELTRNAPGQQMRGDVPLNYPLQPGDTIVVKERWF